MQEKWPPTVRKFRIFVAAISDLVCVCLCLGQAGWFSKCARLFPFELGWWRNKLWENSAFLLWLLLAYVCVRRDATGVVWKFRIFVAAISSLCVCVCVCVCVYVCVYMCCDARHNSRVKIPCFHCGYFQLMCVFVCSALCLDRAGPALRCSSIAGISESETECVPCCQLPHFATLIFGYS